MKDLFQLVFLNWWSDNSVHPACQNQLDMPHQTRQLVFTSLIVIKLTLNESLNECVQRAFLIRLKIDFFTWKIPRKQIRIRNSPCRNDTNKLSWIELAFRKLYKHDSRGKNHFPRVNIVRWQKVLLRRKNKRSQRQTLHLRFQFVLRKEIVSRHERN